MDYPKKDKYNAADLEQIIRILRDPEKGCPWDKVQTHQSIRKNFVEETYEALEAIDKEDPHLLQEELGDVMMQVMLHSQMEAEQGHFTFEDVCDGVCRKLIFRHPHIFAGAGDNTGLNSWQALKDKEKGRVTLRDELESVPATLPALMYCEKNQKRAQRVWDQPAQKADALKELARQIEKLGRESEAEEYGRALFLLVQAARLDGVCAEEALEKYTRKFARQEIEKSEKP